MHPGYIRCNDIAGILELFQVPFQRLCSGLQCLCRRFCAARVFFFHLNDPVFILRLYTNGQPARFLDGDWSTLRPGLGSINFLSSQLSPFLDGLLLLFVHQISTITIHQIITWLVTELP